MYFFFFVVFTKITPIFLVYLHLISLEFITHHCPTFRREELALGIFGAAGVGLAMTPVNMSLYCEIVLRKI